MMKLAMLSVGIAVFLATGFLLLMAYLLRGESGAGTCKQINRDGNEDE